MNIEELRREIDRVDNELLSLFERRMEIAGQIGQYKKQHALPVKNAQRELQLLNRLCEKTKPELAGYVREFFAALIEISCDYQSE